MTRPYRLKPPSEAKAARLLKRENLIATLKRKAVVKTFYSLHPKQQMKIRVAFEPLEQHLPIKQLSDNSKIELFAAIGMFLARGNNGR